MNFAFLIHSRDYTDVQRKFKIAKYLPKSWVEFWCLHWPPVVVSKVTGFKSQKMEKEIKGWLIGIPMTAKQMMENREMAKKKIVKAIKKAEKLGAGIVGLGALTSSVTNGGREIIKDIKIAVTPGHAYTIYTVTSYVLKAIKDFSIPKDKLLVAIVGAAGSIGSGSARYLLHLGIKRFLLIDLERKNERLENLVKNMMRFDSTAQISVSHKIADVKNADIIIAATNAPEALIKPDDLKMGAVIIDDAQPTDISPEVAKEREDVLVADGGVVSTTDVNLHFRMGLARKSDIFSCLGEVLIFSSGLFRVDYKAGEIDISVIKEIGEKGSMLGFKIDNFQRSGRLYTDRQINVIKEVIRKTFSIT